MEVLCEETKLAQFVLAVVVKYFRNASEARASSEFGPCSRTA